MSIEARKQALDYMQSDLAGRIKKKPHAISALRQAIEKAEKQEPVAWVDEMAKIPDHVCEPPFRFRRFVAGSERAEDVVIEREATIEAAARKAAKICPPAPMTVLVYAPPTAQREWVGLTGFEQKELMAMSAREAVFATEAKLKEKNA